MLLFAAEKIKGISFVGSSEPIDSLDVQPIVDVNANWVTLMPYGFIGGDQRIKYNSKWQCRGKHTRNQLSDNLVILSCKFELGA